ncbi:hypothetical protein QFZ40_001624 [Arthrobacter pascens]|uniref:zinc-ribbon domain-containing protein n=1 Tax=Arthrobacter pascens TaxID=1677 RepID=UPI002782BDFC|nr:zinc-ribbon domain-containing protein [Arthrobacter pascens]MDQ0633715.1 hypothetical protein [Arthrobacter pascens]
MHASRLGTLAPGLAPRYIPGEALISYAARLELRIGVDPGYEWSLARSREMAIRRKGMNNDRAQRRLAILCEQMTGIPEGTFERRYRCRDVIENACSLCTGEPGIELDAGGGRLVCPTHRCWTGPSIARAGLKPFELGQPGDGFMQQVAPDVFEAADFLDRVMNQGTAHRRLVDEVIGRVDRARTIAARSSRLGHGIRSVIQSPSEAALVAALVGTLTTPDVLTRIFDPRLTFREAHATLASVVAEKYPRAESPVIDQMWLLIRPTFSWIRTTKLGQAAVERFTPLIIPPDTINFSQVSFPLEPFSRSLDCLSDKGRVGDGGWSDRYVVAQSDPSVPEKFICVGGHIQSTYRSHARRFKDEDFHCAICSGSRAVAGLNSLGDLMPRVASEWDGVANGDLSPYMVTPGSDRKVAWICAKGHPYEAYITNRTLRGTGCPFCAGKALRAGLNDLATTNPQEVLMWDHDAPENPKPTDVSAGNNKVKIYLVCPNGHSFSSTPARLVRTGGRCKECAGTVLVAGLNDLATRRPDVAAWWHPTKNGAIKPEMVRTSNGNMFWWQCPDGHEFTATIRYRTNCTWQTCPADTGRLLVSGYNDLTTKEPDLAKDWDTALNGLGASQTVRGNIKRYWTCAHGHTQSSKVANRRRTGGCTECSPEERVAPARKFKRGRNGWDTRKAAASSVVPADLKHGVAVLSGTDGLDQHPNTRAQKAGLASQE